MRCATPQIPRCKSLHYPVCIVRPSFRYHSSIGAVRSSNNETRYRSIVPSPTQLLRFSFNTSNNIRPGHDPEGLSHRQVQQLLDAEWKLGSPPAALWLPLRGVHPINRRQDTLLLNFVTDVPALKATIEKMVVDSEGAARLQVKNCTLLAQALRRCQSHNTYSEIVALLSDILARLERLKLPIYSQFCELGIYYAALDLSFPALQRFLAAWQRKTAVRLTFGDRIVQAFSSAVNAKLFEVPTYDTSPLLATITGEGGVPSDVHSILFESLCHDQHDFAALLRLLAGIGSDEILYGFWAVFLQTLDTKDLEACRSAYSVILVLIQSGRSETARDFLEDISKQCSGTLPYIDASHNLQALLKDPIAGESLADLVTDEDYKKLLEAGFSNMEQRLGIKWQESQKQIGDRKVHSGVNPNSLWATFTDQPLFTIDGNSAGYDDIARLYPELLAHGCSKSREELGQVVDLLNDYDGDVYNVTVQLNLDQKQWEAFQAEFPTVEFRWCPQQSPIEFSDSSPPASTDQSERWTPASLGLMRARPFINGEPQLGANSLHLMQLGYLETRPGPDTPWKPSGYIVAWDRQFGETVALFVGAYSAVMDRGPTASNGPFGAVMYIRPFDKPHALPLSPDRQHRDYSGRYYLDIDPSPDLGP
ncbi:hypothetical protein N7454_004876 [Penicillium verhagenii]|nr:hypothetical protein N7454_004876 [Penicillium verhagenii]